MKKEIINLKENWEIIIAMFGGYLIGNTQIPFHEVIGIFLCGLIILFSKK